MIQGAIEVVLEELAPYKDIDWLTLRDKMEPDEFEWHRDNFNKHQKRYQKLVGDAQNFEQIIEARQSAITREQAAEAAKELKAEIRSEEHTYELQSLMRISYAVFCLKKQTEERQSHTSYRI